jgi:serine/threonine protein kinase
LRGVGVIDTGQLIAGHYRLVEHIGSGAMGVVWRAVDQRLERSVAVKQILPQPGLSQAERDNGRQRAMREAKNAARLQHPNAIVVFDIAEHEGDPCLVMEYLPSRSLSAILAEQLTLPVPEVARIGEQVASALVAAHGAGIVHRDIKPGNILIGDSGIAKITDFGISRAAGDLTLTQTGLIGGTPAYLAPELARGADPAPSSDVFSLGATLYHAIEGQTPYGNSSNQLALLYTAASGKIIPPTQAGPATALLMSLLRAEPDERPSMAEARERLAALASGGRGGSATLVSPPLLHAGRRPATVAAPPANAPRPPWQRTDPPPAPPRTPTAAYPPPRPQAVPTAATSNGSGTAPKPPAGRSGSKRVLAGGIAAVVLVLAAVMTIVFTSNGDDQTRAAPEPSPSPSAPASPSPSTPSTEPGDTGSAPVRWQPAGTRVIDFYASAGSPESWAMLTPEVQQAFGSQQQFADYWDENEPESYEDAYAYKKENNPDGSVDIRVKVDYGEGPTQKIVTVVDSGGTLLIATDPR